MENIDVIASDVKALAPQFKDYSNEQIQFAAEMASDMVSERQYGKYYERAITFLTAHILTLQSMVEREGAESNALTQTVTSEHEGGLSRSYGGSSSSDSFLNKSIYGLMFVRLREMVIIPVMTRMG